MSKKNHNYNEDFYDLGYSKDKKRYKQSRNQKGMSKEQQAEMWNALYSGDEIVLSLPNKTLETRDDGYTSKVNNVTVKGENNINKTPPKSENNTTEHLCNKQENTNININTVIKDKVQIEFGPNTHTIHNIQIDYDRVANMELVENEHFGNMTYGIKFTFKGKKGSNRIIWFNKDMQERDSVFSSEYRFWISLVS